MAQINWRTIDIDALDPESSSNFDLTSLTPAVQPIATADVQTLAGQVRQLLRGGDSEGALRGALENPSYGADDAGKVCWLIQRAIEESVLRSWFPGDSSPIGD
jgi:actin related protein 2/3 complex subunit 5